MIQLTEDWYKVHNKDNESRKRLIALYEKCLEPDYNKEGYPTQAAHLTSCGCYAVMDGLDNSDIVRGDKNHRANRPDNLIQMKIADHILSHGLEIDCCDDKYRKACGSAYHSVLKHFKDISKLSLEEQIRWNEERKLAEMEIQNDPLTQAKRRAGWDKYWLGLSEEEKSEKARKNKEAQNRPDVKEKKSKSISKTLNDPGVKAKQTAALQSAWAKPGAKEKRSEQMKTLRAPGTEWNKENIRKQNERSARCKAYHAAGGKLGYHAWCKAGQPDMPIANEDAIMAEYNASMADVRSRVYAKQHESQKRAWANPEIRRRRIEGMKAAQSTKEYREHLSEVGKVAQNRPETAAKRKSSCKSAWADPVKRAERAAKMWETRRANKAKLSA